MDSTICLYWAKQRLDSIEAITFDYMQRHRREIQSAVQIAYKTKVKHKIIRFSALSEIVDTALTKERSIIEQINGIPNTFVPNRNLLFLTLASAYGYVFEATLKRQHFIYHAPRKKISKKALRVKMDELKSNRNSANKENISTILEYEKDITRLWQMRGIKWN